MPDDPTPTDLADRLIDAQVAFHLAQLEDDAIADRVAADAVVVLDVLAAIPLGQLITAEQIMPIVRRVLAAVPSSVTASTMISSATDLAMTGPAGPATLGQVVEREHVVALVAEVETVRPLIEQSLRQTTGSPLAGQLAGRFVTKLVIEVLEANQQLADKLPGVRSLMSFGTSAATKVIGAADRPMQQLFGGTASKGSAAAVRLLNSAILEVLGDPLLQDAILEIWDQRADTPVEGLEGSMSRADAHRIAGVLQEIAIGAVVSDPVDDLVSSLVEGFFDVYAEYPITTLMDEMGLNLWDFIGDVQALAPQIVAAAREEGRLERLIRGWVEPFYRSPEAMEILGAVS